FSPATQRDASRALAAGDNHRRQLHAGSGGRHGRSHRIVESEIPSFAYSARRALGRCGDHRRLVGPTALRGGWRAAGFVILLEPVTYDALKSLLQSLRPSGQTLSAMALASPAPDGR